MATSRIDRFEKETWARLDTVKHGLEPVPQANRSFQKTSPYLDLLSLPVFNGENLVLRYLIPVAGKNPKVRSLEVNDSQVNVKSRSLLSVYKNNRLFFDWDAREMVFLHGIPIPDKESK